MSKTAYFVILRSDRGVKYAALVGKILIYILIIATYPVLKQTWQNSVKFPCIFVIPCVTEVSTRGLQSIIVDKSPKPSPGT